MDHCNTMLVILECFSPQSVLALILPGACYQKWYFRHSLGRQEWFFFHISFKWVTPFIRKDHIIYKSFQYTQGARYVGLLDCLLNQICWCKLSVKLAKLSTFAIVYGYLCCWFVHLDRPLVTALRQYPLPLHQPSHRDLCWASREEVTFQGRTCLPVLCP